MHLAVNYSPQAAHLLATGKIAFDRFKCPDWPEVVAAARQFCPVYVHFPLTTRLSALATVDWAQIETFLRQTSTRYVNMHINAHVADFSGMPQDSDDPIWYDRVVEHTLACVRQVTQRFGRENVILENCPWSTDPQFAPPRPSIEAHFVRQIITETGCGLLLDTAHARISALHLGLDPIAYLAALPGEQLREIHVSGTLYKEETAAWLDHFPMTEADWQLIAQVLGCVDRGDWPQPEMITLEYGGLTPLFDWRSDPEVLARDVPRLFALWSKIPPPN